ncbi:excinuclease ABC subunit UvrA [Mariniblastus fucicola]|uniref:UvrABC system protein A n=1 Tax=Mariniblastus fucicola TaxID=980251 RepID=A0A5B9P8P6_9BACT|nr:excinuclease ABC subunit UvrA [Mariniblastus fucicola]QEG21585.1 UvrABC system protein A [Mariniblastus fucicola]
MPEFDQIEVIGARTHCLKNVDVSIPQNQLVVITGRSGSGKSSLAIDTIFAEGQRQFLECQSIHSRQYFDQLPRADVDRIVNLPPTVCSKQQNSGGSPRSTVGTLTEVHDFLRVLFAQAGTVHCVQCGDAIEQATEIDICDAIEAFPEATRMMVLAPLVDDGMELARAIEMVRRERLLRISIDGAIFDIEETPPLDPQRQYEFAAVVDRIIVRDNFRERLLKAIDSASELGQGNILVRYVTPGDLEADASIRSDPVRWQTLRYSTRYACAKCGIACSEISPRLFSFNSPQGACPECQGLGLQLRFDTERVIDRTRSLSEGAVLPWSSFSAAKLKSTLKELQPLLEKVGFDRDRPMSDLSADSLRRLLESTDKESPGIFVLLHRELATTDDDERYEELASLERPLPCPACHGSRLNLQANAVRFAGNSIAEVLNMSLGNAAAWFRAARLDESTPEKKLAAETLVAEIQKRLDYLVEVGVHYLSLGRGADSLSGGELQRVRMGASIGSGLANVCYVLDEPSVGLHARDSERLLNSLRTLKENGNSLIVVEHDETIIENADHLIDVGPGAGDLGGEVVATGLPEQVAAADAASLTGAFLSGKEQFASFPQREVDSKKVISIRGASGFNLKSVDVFIPLHRFVCVSGVSGSGKSTLINRTLAPAIQDHFGFFGKRPETFDSIEGLEQIDKAILIDQAPIGRSSKSCPATFCGLWDLFRKIFSATRVAKQRGYGIGRFSFNSKAGRCDDCKGHGVRRVKMDFMPDLFVECETCKGRRFNVQTLQAKFGTLSIADVLDLNVAQARERFENFAKLTRILDVMLSVGLGYLKLGQPANTLSGGEAQRLKLAKELARSSEGHTLYLLDEPTRGLHFADVRDLLTVLQKLVDQGHSVVVIEHNLDVLKSADWIIDLGPDGGDAGGEVVVCGTPAQVAACSVSITGQFLG